MSEPREIKFRAWYPDENRMEYQKGKTPTWVGDILTDTYYHPMQYTGLTDSNDKEIYEGDVVKLLVGHASNKKMNFRIVFVDGCFGLLRTDNQPNMTTSFMNFRDQCAREGVGFMFDKCLEVIGNIYENPELLK